MNSTLYPLTVMHNRHTPVENAFSYSVFMWCVDLDELEVLSKKIWLFGLNKFNVFSFWDKDHWAFGRSNKTAKEKVLGYLSDNNVDTSKISQIKFITNLRTLGYQFNPVSFYYCFDTENNPLCAVVEVGNTFGEQKPYLLNNETFNGKTFELKTPKYFYVSPFIPHNYIFEFKIGLPTLKLSIHINDYTPDGERFFVTTLKGKAVPITNARVCWYAIRFPFITLQIIGLIHWQAIKLWFRKVRYFKKNENQDMQRGAVK